MEKNKKTANQGFVLTAVLMLLLVGSLVAGAFMISARQTQRTVERWQNYDECLFAAQLGMEKVKSNIYTNFENFNSFTFSWTNTYWLTQNAHKFSTNGTLATIIGPDSMYAGAVISAKVTNSSVIGTFESQTLYVTNTVTASWRGVTRTVEETVRYILTKSEVFDYSYFINNFGWFDNVDMIVNGDLRSNYNMSLNSTKLVLNGNCYAATNKVLQTPTKWTYAVYSNNLYHGYYRPGFNVDLNINNSASVWSNGYNPNTFRTNTPVKLEMSYIGNLDDYRYYAQEKGGTISNNNGLIVNAVYSGMGPSGYTNAEDRTGLTGYSNSADWGSLVLVGTSNNPIRINGPVVIDGDLIIKGYYTGQGTIYAGRNIHVIGDVIATNPVVWKHPEASLSSFTNTTLPANLTKDFLGLCSKGSIVLGDYNEATFDSSVATYLHPPFTTNYEVTATDTDIGYVSFKRGVTNYFNGNYTNNFGYKVGALGTNTAPRRYYESSISDAKLLSLSPQKEIGWIDATLYNNHLTVGKLKGTGTKTNIFVNGGIICRDEALLPTGRMYLNWDPRIAMDTEFRPYLPMGLKPAKTILWRELVAP
jgi:hypothetical protein